MRLLSLTDISPKAYKATAFDGSEAILPKSQVFGQDNDVQKSDAYWVAAWVLEKKDLQYSDKKEGWFNPQTSRIEQSFRIEIEHHVPEKIQPINPHPDDSLIR